MQKAIDLIVKRKEKDLLVPKHTVPTMGNKWLQDFLQGFTL